MIKYRPQRGSLSDAMKEERAFNTLDDMYDYVINHWNKLFSKNDLSVSEDSGRDDRINWKETRYVCTRRIGEEVYDLPLIIGLCSIEK